MSNPPMGIITLTTDFGLTDGFVGAMKGVILGLAPQATVVDLTHGVPRGDVRAGAFALATTCACFPRGTIHVVVVDPGVGSARAALAVQTDDYIFVGPDNGVLGLALHDRRIRAMHRLENRELFRPHVSQTFHGRDVFAPVAAHLNRGTRLNRVGPATNDFTSLPWPQPRLRAQAWEGAVVYVDQFGNAITNLPNDWIPARTENLAVYRAGRRLAPLAECYAAVPPGRPVAVRGSSGFMEIAVNGGHAARQLRLRIEQKIVIRSSSRS